MQKKQKLKRLFDVVAAAVGAVVFMPVMLATAAVMGVANRSFPLFFQKRIGKDRKLFTIVKIKTMKDKRDGQGVLLPGPERTTKAGVFVRKAKLDELPQLFNVLRGDMSLVGPRPLMEDVAVAHDPVRYSIRPGLTGLAQIFNANSPSHKGAIGRDIKYVERLSSHGGVSNLIYDLRTIAATPVAIVKHRKSPHFKGR